MQIVHGLHEFILSTSSEGQKGEMKSALALFYLNIVLRLGNQPDLNYSVKSSIRRCIWITLLAFA